MSRYDLSREELGALLAGLPSWRGDQLYDGLYRRLAEPEELTDLPSALRRQLASEEALRPALKVLREEHADHDTTIKWLFGLSDGASIETVLMYYPRHATVCVSSQAGCAMGCTFCATGQAGYERQLRAGEIIEQVVRAARAAKTAGRRLDHVVFMGMGEPFANFAAVLQAVRAINSDLGLAARHITLSTVGLIPQIRLLAKEPLQVNLAVSLHAARDELRNELVPINRRYPIGELIDACAHYLEQTKRRISFEWALIDHVNDQERDVAELAELAQTVRAHVNLIPLNETALGGTRGLLGASPARVRAFRDGLLARGITTTVRQTRGRSIAAACGQLASSTVPLVLGKRPRLTTKHTRTST